MHIVFNNAATVMGSLRVQLADTTQFPFSARIISSQKQQGISHDYKQDNIHTTTVI